MDILIDLNKTNKFEFETFANQGEYIKVNQDFVASTLDIRPNLVILDIACGTGLIINTIRNYLSGLPVNIIGIDPSYSALEAAKVKIKTIGETKVEFTQAFAQDMLSFVPKQSIDFIYFCNAIHELPDNYLKQSALQAAFQALKPGGKIFINTAFVKESYPNDAMKKWGLLKLYAMQKLQKKRNKKSGTFDVLLQNDYNKMLEQVGFKVISNKLQRVDMTKESVIAISKYEPFIKGVFIDMEETENVSTETKSQALIEAVEQLALENKIHNGETSPLIFGRNWAEFIALKPDEKNSALY